MPTLARLAALPALMLLGAAAHGQLALNGVNIVVGDTTLAPGESTTIRMEAYFDPRLHCMGGIDTSLRVSTGSLGLSDLSLVAPMNGPGTSPGVPTGTGVDGIIAGQLHGFIGAGIYGDTSNPIAFWQATYTAPPTTTDPLTIELRTETRRFDVYLRRDSAVSESRLDEMAEGMAQINIVPAPAGVLALAGLAVPALRRRRVVPARA